MDAFVNKFAEYAELVFYMMFISVLMVITAVPIFTIGAAVTSGYKVFLDLKDYDYSMSLGLMTKIFLKCFIRKLLPTSITTVWFIIMIYSCYKLPALVKMNFILMPVVFLILFEMILLFQIIFIIYAQAEHIPYFDAISSSFLIAHKFLFYVIAMAVIQAGLMGFIFIFRWTIILMPGLSLFINMKIFKSKMMGFH